MKRCSLCRQEKPLDDFYRSARAALKPRKNRVRPPAPAGCKHCLDCAQVKPLDEFCNNRRNGDGKAAYCKDCHNARSRETRDRLYGGGRHYHLMRRYGVGDADVAAMIEAQGGLCAICEGPLERPHVDHDHKTGKVRGILCFNCNAGLGKFQDKVEVMALAVEYLRRHA